MQSLLYESKFFCAIETISHSFPIDFGIIHKNMEKKKRNNDSRCY